jgi:hypothetical protein
MFTKFIIFQHAKTITFSPYNENELRTIIETRVGKDVVSPCAIQMIAEYVAKKGGSADHALTTLYTGIVSCSEKTLPGATSFGFIVSQNHIEEGKKL